MEDRSAAQTVALTRALSGHNLAFVEELYARFLADPTSVDPSWQSCFAALAANDGDLPSVRHAVDGPRFAPASIFAPATVAATAPIQAPPTQAPSALDLPALSGGELASRLRFLQELKLFREIPADEVALVARLATEETLEPGQFLFREGEAGSALYLLTAGQLLIQRKGQVALALHPGEVVGELSLLDAQPRSADVVAHGEVRVLRLGGEDLLQLMERRPALARGLVLMLTNRLRERGSRQDKVNQLIHAFRVRGHLRAQLDPLRQGPPRTIRELTLEHWGLSERDQDALFSSTTLAGTTSILTLREILTQLEATYCGSIGVQFMHIDDWDKKQWLITHLEDPRYHRTLTRDEQLRILTKLTDAQIFEQFIHKKFLGAKRFSLEGAETLIPLLELTLERAGAQGVRETVIGMAHRGRLNVLVNILGKSAREVFREFADADADLLIGRGDVKYHLGYSSDRTTAEGNRLHLSLCFNPSHLEFVNPVLVGRVRAKQDRYADREHRQCLGILIHGDAAFAGQGVLQEVFNLSDLPGYRTGGTVHIVVNNQIGFTTPPESGRSTTYATEVARMLQTPIFHVNGEDPEAVAHVVDLAMAYRQEFRQDVILDMYCFRRYGHNEGDEPAYTQPLLYEVIRQRKSVREGYLDHLLKLGITRAEADAIETRRRQQLEAELSEAQAPDFQPRGPNSGEGLWRPYRGGADADTPEVPTGVPVDQLRQLLEQTCRVPEGFARHPKLDRFFAARQEMARGERPLDWGAAEALALASLAVGGAPVRLSGQDSGRGTFSHRHAVLHDVATGAQFIPLQHLAPDQAPCHVWDSPLSEIGVLGFEYGYSLDTPDGLTLWEAQFGDFCNVAQVIIDQFIASGEDKWRRLSGLVMLLPHGFEGQGPEHSSARLERFLNLAAEDNLQVVNLTTPAQLFHCLRRQVLRPLRKPLILLSPKSLLRYERAVSGLDELATGRFLRVIPDLESDPRTVRKVLLTSGKMYYDLLAARAERKDLALLRLEQYYPLAEDQLLAALAPFPDGTPVVWVQEEPHNMGAWSFLKLRFGSRLFDRWPLTCISRPSSASPATGSAGAHKKEQAVLLAAALD